MTKAEGIAVVLKTGLTRGRTKHVAGETVEVSKELAANLVSNEQAIYAKDEAKRKAAKDEAKRKAAKVKRQAAPSPSAPSPSAPSPSAPVAPADPGGTE